MGGSELQQRAGERREGLDRRGNRYVSAMTHRRLVFIASGRREGARGQTVWEAASTASLHRQQGVVEGERERRDTAEMKHVKEGALGNRQSGGEEDEWK